MSRLKSDDVVVDLSMVSVPVVSAGINVDSNTSSNLIAPTTSDNTLLAQHSEIVLPTYHATPLAAIISQGNENGNEEDEADGGNTSKFTTSLTGFAMAGFYSAFWSVVTSSDLQRAQTKIVINKNDGGCIKVAGTCTSQKSDEEERDEDEDQDVEDRAEKVDEPKEAPIEATIQLRLDKKLWIQPGDRVDTELHMRTGEGKSAVALLFELQPFDSLLDDNDASVALVVDYYMDIPLTLVPPSTLDGSMTIVVDSALSSDQRSLVTLSRTRTDWFLDVWNLDAMATTSQARAPLASVHFTGIETESDEIEAVKVEISSNGEFLAVYKESGCRDRWNPTTRFEVNKSPIRVFQKIPTSQLAPKTKQSSDEKKLYTENESQLETLVEVFYASYLPLSSFVGALKFQHRTPGNLQPTPKQEYVLVASDGHFLYVYDIINSKITPQYTISFAPLLVARFSSDAAIHFVRSLQDTLGIWLGHPSEELSVWNWRTRECVGRFSGGHEPTISKDETTLVLQKAATLNIYTISTETRLCFSEMRLWRDDFYFNIPFGDHGHLAGLDWKSKTGQGRLHVMDILNPGDDQVTGISFPVKSKPLACMSLSWTDDGLTTVPFVTKDAVLFLKISAPMEEAVPKSEQEGCGQDCIDNIDDDQEKGDQCMESVDMEQGCTFKIFNDLEKNISRVVRVVETQDYMKEQILLEFNIDSEKYRRAWAFLPSQKQRFIVRRQWELLIWELPQDLDENVCKLVAVVGWFQNRWLCVHENMYQLDDVDEKLMFDLSPKYFLRPRDTITLINNFETFSKEWSEYPVSYQKAVIRLIEIHINKCPGEDLKVSSKYIQKRSCTSVMWGIALATAFTGDELFMRHVLASNHRRFWTPQDTEFSADPEKDLIAHLISEFKLPVVKILIEYCLARAHDTDSKFLDLLMISVPHLMEKHPDVALDIARRASFIPARNRGPILQQAITHSSPWRLKFWKPAKTHLYQVIDENPIFHRLHQLPLLNHKEHTKELITSLDSDPFEAFTKNVAIKSHVFVAPYSLIWTIRSRKDITNSATKVELLPSSTPFIVKVLRMMWHFVYPFDTVFIHTIYDDLEVFDSPAMMALMTYKWNRFSRYVWAVRMMFQVTYELLVLAVTFVQIYEDDDQQATLGNSYIAIIVLGYLLLHLEFQQMRSGLGQYLSSAYNYVDLSAYIIPLAASCSLLVDSERIDSLRALSFAIILIYLHFIFELRVYKNVCKVVTIVVNIMLEIPAFFMILAVFILAFAHSINHLTQVNFRSADCLPNDDGSASACQTVRQEFPTSYLQTVSATYFFMTGDYGPVGTSLTDGHWTNQLMIALFFFLTAVLMMNVVIALMNGAYSDAVIVAEQTWLKNRLELVASAENLTYFLPNFRDYFDYFPKHVYYTATDKDMADYRAKFNLEPLPFDFSTPVEDTVWGDNLEAPDNPFLVSSRTPSQPITTESIDKDNNNTDNNNSQEGTETESQPNNDLILSLQSELSEIKPQLENLQEMMRLLLARVGENKVDKEP